MRKTAVERNTAETQIKLELDLDNFNEPKIVTGVPFFDHMLHQVAMHGRLGVDLQAKGDLEIDAHHLVEDVGIVFGQALHKALGDKRGITRYASSYVPLDEALSRVVIDCSGRPGLFYRVEYKVPRVGEFDLQLVREFFQGLVNHAAITVHIDNLYGYNAHHQAESLFKAFGRCLRKAIYIEGNVLPSTKKHL